MIPTQGKDKLPKTLSWPLGAEAISAGLVGAPHIDKIKLRFRDSPVWPASEFKRLLRESVPYALVRASYSPASKPGYGGSRYMIERGFYETTWELTVYPVLSPLRPVAGILLQQSGLPVIANWLHSSDQTGWETWGHVIILMFDPVNVSLTLRR